MKVKDLQDRVAIDEITLKITAKEEPRDVRGGSLKVCNFTGEDEDGDKVSITLWNDDITKVKEGDKVKITGGWASVFNNTMQVSTGRNGNLEVLGSSEENAESKTEQVSE